MASGRWDTEHGWGRVQSKQVTLPLQLGSATARDTTARSLQGPSQDPAASTPELRPAFPHVFCIPAPLSCILHPASCLLHRSIHPSCMHPASILHASCLRSASLHAPCSNRHPDSDTSAVIPRASCGKCASMHSFLEIRAHHWLLCWLLSVLTPWRAGR